jgi:ABC-type glycerol-3-phosphate transport system permease component
MAIDLNDRAFLDRLIEAEKKRSNSGGKWMLIPAVVLAIAFLTPFYYLFVTVFKSNEEYARKGVLELPDSLAPIVDNVVEAWTSSDVGTAMFNSATYGVIGASLAIAIAAIAAYGLTRLRGYGANSWFLVIFAGTLFPFQMYLVPLLFTYQRVGLVNSWLGMLLLYTAICIPFPLLVLRNAFGGINREIDSAARIDGASEWRVFISMIVPNAWGPIVALFLLQFTFIWNDLLFSSVLANGNKVRSIMVALQTLQGTYAATGPNVVATAALIASLPTVLLFIVLRKYFMSAFQLNS